MPGDIELSKVKSAISELSLKDCIRLYATIVVDDWSGTERVELHDRICELLGTSNETFNPFKAFSIGCRIHSEVHAEQLIRCSINTIEKDKLEEQYEIENNVEKDFLWTIQ